jgi:hypothetical protein
MIHRTSHSPEGVAMDVRRSKEQQQFVDYLKRRWQDLTAANDYLIHKLREDEEKWVESVNAGKSTEADANHALGHAEHVVSRSLRYAMLTSFCTFLEETAREFASRAFPSDFQNRAEKNKGSKFRKYVSVVVDADFDTSPIREDLEKFDALIILRNCVVHAWGNISRTHNPDATRQAVNKIESAGIYKDGFLYFGDCVLSEAIIAAENIADAMIDQLLPKTCTPLPSTG